jgi:TM2 domain-containing membrane protein YozV
VANSKEVLLWSIALPGFGQFLNGKLIKGIVFVFLEFLINVNANFNVVIISSFQGEIEKAIA